LWQGFFLSLQQLQPFLFLLNATQPKTGFMMYQIGANGLQPLHAQGLRRGMVVSYEDMANPRCDFVIVSEDWQGSGLPAVSVDGQRRTEVNTNQLEGAGGWQYTEAPDWSDETIAELMANRQEVERVNKLEVEAKDAERKRTKEVGENWLKENKPEWACAAIIARKKSDDSNVQTDYFGTIDTDIVLLAFSKTTRNNMKELRNAAGNCEATQHLQNATEKAEHRERYSGGGGYYLADGWHRSMYGWLIEKMPLTGIMLSDVYEAISKNQIYAPLPQAQDANGLQVVEYSNKAIAVIGDTKPHKELLKQCGGKFNKRLEIDGQKVAGWIFSKKAENQVRKMLNL